jgi:hypothetical protein
MRLLSSRRRALGHRAPAPPSEDFLADYGTRRSAPTARPVAAVRYFERHRVPCDIVECGVWKAAA